VIDHGRTSAEADLVPLDAPREAQVQVVGLDAEHDGAA
jgi:hypothetical protein